MADYLKKERERAERKERERERKRQRHEPRREPTGEDGLMGLALLTLAGVGAATWFFGWRGLVLGAAVVGIALLAYFWLRGSRRLGRWTGVLAGVAISIGASAVLYSLVGPEAVPLPLVIGAAIAALIATTRARDRRLTELLDASPTLGRTVRTVVVSIALPASESDSLASALARIEGLGAGTGEVDRAYRACEAIAEHLDCATAIAIRAETSEDAALADLDGRDARQLGGGYRDDATEPRSSEDALGTVVVSLVLDTSGAAKVPDPPATREEARAALVAIPPVEIRRTKSVRVHVCPASDQRSFTPAALAEAFPELRPLEGD